MIGQISHYIESKTGVYLHPRFIMSVLGLSSSLLIFGVAYTLSQAYADSVRTVGPSDSEERGGYDTRSHTDTQAPNPDR